MFGSNETGLITDYIAYNCFTCVPKYETTIGLISI